MTDSDWRSHLNSSSHKSLVHLDEKAVLRAKKYDLKRAFLNGVFMAMFMLQGLAKTEMGALDKILRSLKNIIESKSYKEIQTGRHLYMI